MMHPVSRIALGLGVMGLLAVCQTPARAWDHQHPGSAHTAYDAFAASLLQGTSEPWRSGYQQLLDESEVALLRVPPPVPAVLHVPAISEDPEGHGAALVHMQDATDAYVLALRWYIGPEVRNGHSRQEFRAKAIERIMSWSNTPSSGEGDTGLAITYSFASFLYAADILLSEPAWDGYNQFEHWMTTTFRQEALNALEFRQWWAPYGNNHNTWGIHGLLLYAHLMHDDEAFDEYTAMLKDHIDKTIEDDGAMPAELIRHDGLGLWYTFLAMAPLTAAMRIVRNVTGGQVELYDRNTLYGRKVRNAVQSFYHFNTHPFEVPGYHVTASDGVPQIPQAITTVAPLFETMAGEWGGNQELVDYIAPGRPSLCAYASWQRATVFSPLAAPFAGQPRMRPHNFQDGVNDFTPVAGSWSVASEASGSTNKVYKQASTSVTNARAITGSTEWMSYKLSARVKVVSFNTNTLAGVGLMVRYADANNYYTAHFYKNGDRLRIEEKKDGVLREVATVAFPFATGRWYQMDLVAEGPHLKFYVDGKLKLEDHNYQDPTSPDHPGMRDGFGLWAGKVGLFAHRTQALFDNVTMSAPPLDMRFSNQGELPTSHCVRTREDADRAGTWLDNYLCMNQDIGLLWSNAGQLPGMRCEAIYEDSEPPETTWADNYVCVPLDSPYHLKWSPTGEIAGKTCTRWLEPSDPHDWLDNYLCY